MFNIRNRYLVWRFPYLKPRRYDGTFIPDYTYASTDLDCYPDGWRKLIIVYCKKINKILKRYNELDNFYIVDAKEKWGSARLYYSGISHPDCRTQIDELLWQLEYDSSHTCNLCGKKAEYISKGYILPFCSDCMEKQEWFNFEKIED